MTVSDPGPELAAKVAVLRDPAGYPGHPPVEAIETHMSWVFLAGPYAYKLKKPVWREYLDFRALAARRHFCEEEVRLNAALAPGTYLGVVPLNRTPGGVLHLAGAGDPVEWLVHMRRLPRQRMLNVVLGEHALTREPVADVAALLADFYRRGPAVETDGPAYRRLLVQRLADNAAVLGDPAFGMAAVASAIDLRLRAFVDQFPRLLERRAGGGHVIEGHGDLRPEHVCLESPPLVFDRLEFNRDFRIADAADELAGLGMECERLGAAFAGELLFQRYEAATGDIVAPALRHFYAAYRAGVRARLAILHTRDNERPLWPHWQQLAADYLRLAGEHAAPLPVQLCRSSVSEPPV